MNNPIRLEECPICKKEFTKKYNLKVHHDSVHLKLKSFECTICGNTFSQKVHLSKHLLKHQNPNNSENLVKPKAEVKQEPTENLNQPKKCIPPKTAELSSHKHEKIHSITLHSRLYKCLQCSFESPESFQIIQHHQENHEKKYE
jgi:transposase-like protein